MEIEPTGSHHRDQGFKQELPTKGLVGRCELDGELDVGVISEELPIKF